MVEDVNEYVNESVNESVNENVDGMVAQLRAVRAGLGALDVDALDRAVVQLAELRAQVEAVWLQALALAGAAALHQRHGHRDLGTWIAALAGERRGDARRDAELADALHAAPVVAEAVAGGLSKAKAGELLRAADLPSEVQSELVEVALEAPVEQVSALVRRARLDHGVVDEPVTPTATIVRRRDRVRVEATLDLVDGEHLEVALDTLAEQLDLARTTTYAERRALALGGLARFYLDHAEDVPASRLGRPHVLVLVDMATLEATEGGSATLASGAVVTGEAARRLAEDANVSRVVTSGRSEPLDVGRSTRTIPPAIAKAVIVRDRHCRYRGCTSPPTRCEIHHLQPWAHGGRTAVDNLGLLCWHHHHLVHERGPHHLIAAPGGEWELAPSVGSATAAVVAA